MITVRASAGLGAVAALVAVGWLLAADRVDEPAPKLIGPIAASPPARVVGSAGCSGIACHGGPLPDADHFPKPGWVTGPKDPDRWRYSDTLFRCYDPHTRALDVLSNDLSNQIVRKLAPAGAEPVPATRDARCLACHVTPALATRPDDALVSQGIGCEACHGSAGGWVGEHAGWAAGPNHRAHYARTGMTDLTGPLVRATTCAGCHVGAPAAGEVPVRDMNHDLIAAGHPRLNFDYGTYLRALPPHWTEKDRDVSPPALRPASDTLTHWLVGQAMTAKAADRLRADRAVRGPWPEFAEFDCYACHHGLTGSPRAPLGPRPGDLVWNETPLAAQLFGRPGRQRTSPDHPLDTQGIRAEAERSAAGWDQQGGSLPLGWGSPKAVAVRLANITPRRWDEACHLYYALLAIDRAANPDGPEAPDLAKVRVALRLPREADGMKYNSPLDVHPAELGFPDLFRVRAR